MSASNRPGAHHYRNGVGSDSGIAVNKLVRENRELKAKLAAALAVPACRDAGHVETIHSAAGCCDPYETPCAAYTASMRATARGAEERTPTGADRAEECTPSPGRATVQKDGAGPTECPPTGPAPRDRAGCGGVGCPCSDDCPAIKENQP